MTTTTTNLNIKTDRSVKEKAEQIFSDLGLNIALSWIFCVKCDYVFSFCKFYMLQRKYLRTLQKIRRILKKSSCHTIIPNKKKGLKPFSLSGLRGARTLDQLIKSHTV